MSKYYEKDLVELSETVNLRKHNHFHQKETDTLEAGTVCMVLKVHGLLLQVELRDRRTVWIGRQYLRLLAVAGNEAAYAIWDLMKS